MARAATPRPPPFFFFFFFSKSSNFFFLAPTVEFCLLPPCWTPYFFFVCVRVCAYFWFTRTSPFFSRRWKLPCRGMHLRGPATIRGCGHRRGLQVRRVVNIFISTLFFILLRYLWELCRRKFGEEEVACSRAVKLIYEDWELVN